MPLTVYVDDKSPWLDTKRRGFAPVSVGKKAYSLLAFVVGKGQVE